MWNLWIQRDNYIEALFWFNPDYFIYFSRTRNKPSMAYVVLSVEQRVMGGRRTVFK